MPNAEVVRDDEETYETVIRPLLDKITKVCQAFDMPFVVMFQPLTEEHGGTVRGEVFTPPHTSMHMSVAAHLLAARDTNDLERRIMKVAAVIAMRDMKSNMKFEMKEGLRDLFAQMEGPGDNDDKPLN